MSTTVPDGSRAATPSASAEAGPRHDRVIDLDAVPPRDRDGNRRVRDAVHAVLCALSGVLITVGFALDVGGDTEDGAALVAAVTDAPDRFYWSNTLAALGLALLAAVGLAVLRLVRGRGRVLATVGGLLLMIGGAAAAAGLFMYGAVVTAMVESGEDPAVVAALQDHFQDSVRTGLPFFVGFPGILLALLVTAVALLVSRATPRWVPAALAASVVGIVALDGGSAARVVDVVLTAALAGIAWSLWRQRSAAEVPAGRPGAV